MDSLPYIFTNGNVSELRVPFNTLNRDRLLAFIEALNRLTPQEVYRRVVEAVLDKKESADIKRLAKAFHESWHRVEDLESTLKAYGISEELIVLISFLDVDTEEIYKWVLSVFGITTISLPDKIYLNAYGEMPLDEDLNLREEFIATAECFPIGVVKSNCCQEFHDRVAELIATRYDGPLPADSSKEVLPS